MDMMKQSSDQEIQVVDDALVSLLLNHNAVEIPPVGKDLIAAVLGRYQRVRIDVELPKDFDSTWMSSTFLRIARGGHRQLGLHTIGQTRATNGHASTRSTAIAKALEQGFWELLSPFTGHLEPVSSSLGREWYPHVHDGEVCLASQFGNIMVMVDVETLWVFPQRKLILYVSNGYNEAEILDHVCTAYDRWLKQAPAIAGYLAKANAPGGRTLALTDTWCPHMSHNLWNLQTGWANVFGEGKTPASCRFLAYDDQNFFGTLAELFPETVNDENLLTYVRNDDEILTHTINENLLTFTVKDEFFTDDLVDRLIQQALMHCSQEFLSELQEFRTKSDPLIITTIRLDNRAWIEQQAGLPALFGELQKKFPNMGLIIDGLSSDTSKGWTTSWMSMEAELEMAESVRTHLPENLPVMFSVGRTFAESLVMLNSADLFVAPSGSGMGIYKWISNLPGLAFSNRSVLDPHSPHRWPLLVWHNPLFRNNITETIHLDPEWVTDGPMERDHISRANFHLDWRHIYDAAVPLINKILNNKNRPYNINKPE